MKQTFVVDILRTLAENYGGALSSVRPDAPISFKINGRFSRLLHEVKRRTRFNSATMCVDVGQAVIYENIQ